MDVSAMGVNGGSAHGFDATAAAKDDFSMPSETIEVAGLLFDMDGTIIDSTEAVIRHWTSIGEEIGVDPNVILATSHGRRSIDTLRVLNPSKANWDYVRKVESIIPHKYGSDAVEIPGARALLDALTAVDARWTIVTSGTKPLVEGWLSAFELPRPRSVKAAVPGVGDDGVQQQQQQTTMVTAEDVEAGKPDPACYRLGRRRLFPSASSSSEEQSTEPGCSAPILALEDAPAGIKAGHDAGCRVIALATSHSIEQLVKTEADWIVKDMRSVRLVGVDAVTGRVSIEISNALRR